ncbi:hypothetical protein BGZ73_002532 [Actinomortierella ambigua]|nr:hypothetical protein BGZ73_002532 [Actinomortierella ambigua]
MKFTSILGAVAVASVATAAPYGSFDFFEGDNKCIPELNIKEYESFNLRSSNLNTYLSTQPHAMPKLLIAGTSTSVDANTLEMCVASTNGKCNPSYPTNCIYDNVDYYFRVEKPLVGYLRLESHPQIGQKITITQDYRQATLLNFYKEAGWGLRIAKRMSNGDRLVFETAAKGQPLVLNKPVKDNSRQWFNVKSTKPTRFWGDSETCGEQSMDLEW